MTTNSYFGFSKKSQEEIDRFKILPFDNFRYYSELDDKKISIAFLENLPFGKELKTELERNIAYDKEKFYFKDESSIINYKYYFYNDFYNFLFKVIVKFDELNIGSRKDEKEKEKYTKSFIKDFETQLKASITYSKYVTKRFFEIYPHLKTQFKIKKTFKIIDIKSKKINANGSDNRLIEWYSTEKFQRLMMLIDLREKDISLEKATHRRKSKDVIRYMEILRRVINRDFLGTKETKESIIFDVTYDLSFDKKEQIKFSNKFYSWVRRNNKIIDKEKLKLTNPQLISY